MKKAVAAGLILIIIACLILTAAPWNAPSLDAAESGIAIGEDGEIYLAENRDGRSYIYGVGDNGALRSLYSEDNRVNGRASAITELCAGGGSLYYIRSLRALTSGEYDGWELCRLNLETGSSDRLLKGDTTKLSRVSSIAFAGGKVYLTGVDSGQSSVSRSEEPSENLGYYGKQLENMGVIEGYADGSYDPGSVLTWGELLKMVVTAVSAPVPPAGQGGHWAQRYVDAAVSSGLIGSSEISDDTLDKPVTKFELARILALASEKCLREPRLNAVGAGSYIDNFSSIPAQYSDSVAQCYAKGILDFSDVGLYESGGTVSRGQGIEAVIRLVFADSRHRTPMNRAGYASYLSGSSAAVYLANPGGGDSSLSLILQAEAPAGTEIVDAAYGGGFLYCLLGDGRLSRSSASDTVILEKANTHYSALDASSGGVWVYEDLSGTAVILSGAFTGAPVQASPDLAVLTGTGDSTGRMAVLAVNSEGRRVLLVKNSDNSSFTFSRLRPGLSKSISFKMPELLFGFLGIVILGGAVLTVFALIRYGRSFSRRIIITTFSAFLLAALALSLVLCDTSVKILRDERLAQASAWGSATLSNISETDLAAVSGEDFYASESYAALIAALKPSVVQTSDGAVRALSEIYSADGEPAVAVSPLSQHGLPAARALPSAAAALLKQAAESGRPASDALVLSGRWVGVYARPVIAFGKTVGILLTTVSMDDLEAKTIGFVRQLLLADALVLIICFLLVFLFTRGITSSMRQLISRMNTITRGKFKLDEVHVGSDEIGTLWKTMREMSVALGIRDYETKATLASYYRFVPRGIDKLLGRPNIMEVGFGDSTKLTGTVGLISISRRNDFASSLSDSQFMDFVNRCFGAINSSVTKHNGLLLSSDFDLSSVRAFYPESPDDGMRCSLSLMGELSGVADADMTMLLHEASFLYGVAGTEERAFPFLSSTEMNYLSSLAGQFKNTGARVVMTEQCLKSLRGSYSTRYIGFVASPDGSYIYKVHELLDAYPDTEKALRQQNDKRFQEAVQLFYKNDFYLARNLFSSILRACPNDGIARWYLFASEYYFNSLESAVEEERNYNLFGVE